MSLTTNRRVRFWFKLITSAGLLAGLVWHFGSLREIGTVMAGIAPSYILLILGVNTLDRAVMTYKWILLLRGRGMDLPFLSGMKIYCSSMIWGLFLPSTVGADAIRAYHTTRAGFHSDDVIASIIVERVLGFLSALVLGLFSLVLLSEMGTIDERFRYAWWAGVGLIVAGVALVAVSLSRTVFDFLVERAFRRYRESRAIQRLRQFHGTYASYRKHPGVLARFLGLTFGEQLMPIFHSWLIAKGLGIHVGILFFAGAVPLSILVSRLPVSIDGIGVFEGSFVLLMSFAGISANEAVAIALVGRILQTASWLPWWTAHVIAVGDAKPPRTVLEHR